MPKLSIQGWTRKLDRTPRRQVHDHQDGSPSPAMGCVMTVRLWMERRRQRRALGELAELNSYLLEDIGLSQEEARREAARPFWQINRETRSMPRAWILAAALRVFSQATQAAAEPACKPVLVVKDVGFSEVINLKRFWTATVDVDASRCAASSGLFALAFVRLAENAPDLEFAEPFIWRAPQTKVRVEFSADEAVHAYRIDDVAACPCRGN